MVLTIFLFKILRNIINKNLYYTPRYYKPYLNAMKGNFKYVFNTSVNFTIQHNTNQLFNVRINPKRFAPSKYSLNAYHINYLSTLLLLSMLAADRVYTLKRFITHYTSIVFADGFNYVFMFERVRA